MTRFQCESAYASRLLRSRQRMRRQERRFWRSGSASAGRLAGDRRSQGPPAGRFNARDRAGSLLAVRRTVGGTPPQRAACSKRGRSANRPADGKGGSRASRTLKHPAEGRSAGRPAEESPSSCRNDAARHSASRPGSGLTPRDSSDTGRTCLTIRETTWYSARSRLTRK